MIYLLIIKSLCGFALMMLGLILAIHSTEYTTVGLLVSFAGLIAFWTSLPSCAENRARHKWNIAKDQSAIPTTQKTESEDQKETSKTKLEEEVMFII